MSLSACGGGRVTVLVATQDAEGALKPMKDRPVRFLPFNRDSVFDALAARAEEPEPVVPEDLKEAFNEVSKLQQEWRQAEAEWSDVREQLKSLSERMRRMDPRSREYRRLFDQFNSLDRREKQLDRAKKQAFGKFDKLQKASLARADSIRAVRESWEDVAFRDYQSIVDSILSAEGKEIYEDTTGADGYVTQRLPSGDWYVHTRYSIPFGELYWNLLINPAEVDTVRLTRENAEERLQF
ncbi:MAG: hypothetical protein ACE5HQ_10825 [Gemmatimonadota bacterium]